MGKVTIYPTLPLGQAFVPGMPAAVDDNGKPMPVEVDSEEADRLLAYMPPAFTKNADGKPMKYQEDAMKAQFAAAWAEPAEEPDAPEPQPEAEVTEGDK